MNQTATVTETMDTSDANLVFQSLGGNRDAFARIVTRYQSLICSLAYSATGNFSRSEDLAQETFVTAWKELRQLREPQRLRSWLCGIARNIINNSFRRQHQEVIHTAEPLEAAHEAPASESVPSERAIQQEEETIVWSALEKVPEVYREPLILFYRENQSVEQVAHQLDLSQDAVRQRLARGREMLRSQVAEVIEGVLKRSRPGRTFTLAVLAALPGVVAGSATAAGVGAAGTAGPAAKALLASATSGALLGALGGLAGAAVGSWATWQTARYQRQRDLIRRGIIQCAIACAIFIAPFVAMSFIGWGIVGQNPLAYAISLTVWILGFMLFSAAWSYWLVRENRRILREESAAGTPPIPETPLVSGMTRWSVKWEGRQWRSPWTFLGWPLIQINFSSPDANSFLSKATLSAQLPKSKQAVARGWIALGDRAQGILFAGGNIALGGIAFGGLSCGVVAFGGLSFGLVSIGGAALGAVALGGLAIGALAWGGGAFGGFAFGGLAVGWFAFGGGAFGWHAAQGGLAYAHQFAKGGRAVAAHANDAIASNFLSQNWFFQASEWAMVHVLPWIQGPKFFICVMGLSFFFPALLLAVGYRRKKSSPWPSTSS